MKQRTIVGKKNFVLITQQIENQNKLRIKNFQLKQAMTPKMPYKKIQTSQSLSCDHSLELKKNISTPCIDKKHEQLKKLRNIQLSLQYIGKQKRDLSNSVNKKKLIFTPKSSNHNKNKRKRKFKRNDENPLARVNEQFKNIIQDLRATIQQIKRGFKQMFEQILLNIQQFYIKTNKQIQSLSHSQIKSGDSSMLDTSFNIECEAFKVQRIFKKYEKMGQDIKKIPHLDFSTIQNLDSPSNVKITPKQKFKKLIQTERNGPKKFQFQQSQTAQQKFQTFKNTLKKMKKISELQNLMLQL